MTERKAKYATDDRKAYQASDDDMQKYAPLIREVIAHHVGRNRAINADLIAEKVGITGKYANRKTRSIISRMVDEQDDFIGSSPSDPPGYWLIADRAEVQDVLRNWRNRSLSIMRRYKVLSDRAFKKFGIPVEQLRLEI